MDDRVLIYARVSSEKQETYSIDNQVQSGLDWCNKHGYTNIRIIKETGSGESMVNRPGMLQALDLAEKREYDILYVYDKTREGRKSADTAKIMELFRVLNIKVATPDRTYDYKNPNDALFAQIQGSFAEYEYHKIKNRSRDGRRKAKENGNYIGEFLPYGYKAEKIYPDDNSRPITKIIQDKTEVEGLLVMIDLAEQGLSTRAIAKELTKRGFNTKTGKAKWNKATVNEILKSSWLYGKAVYFKQESSKYDGKRIYTEQPEENWITHKVPSIISKERFDALQNLIKKRTKNSTKQTAYQYLFADKLTCQTCLEEVIKRNELNRSSRIGHRTDWYIHTSKGGKKTREPRYPYYVCVGRTRHMRDWTCDLPQIRATTLDEKLWEETKTIIKEPKLIHDAIVYSSKETIEKKRVLDEELKKIRQEIAEKKERKDVAAHRFLTSTVAIPQEKYESIISTIENEIASLHEKIKQLESTEIKDTKPSLPKEPIEQVCNAIAESIDKYDFDMKRKVVEVLYEDIIIDNEWNITLQGRIPLAPEGQQALCDLPDSYQHLALASFLTRFY